MNQNTANSRLERIRKISRVLKIALLLYFITPLIFLAWSHSKLAVATKVSLFNHSYASFSDVPVALWVLSGIGSGLYLMGGISVYRLLNLYEKGIVFSKANSLELRKIGQVLIAWGFLGLGANIVVNGAIILHLVIVDGLASPWVIGGGGVYILSWIMDEGRKIQEEQALTV